MRRSWSWRDMLPNGTALTLRRTLATEDGLLVEAEGAPSAPCPACGQPSAARHSRYWRSLKDVAVHGRAVTLRVRVSRWRCRNARCDTAIFSERLVGVAARHVQETTRFGVVVHVVGHARGEHAKLWGSSSLRLWFAPGIGPQLVADGLLNGSWRMS